MYQSPSELGHVDVPVRDAVRFVLGIAVTGAVVLLAAVVWVSTCRGATADLVACGPPQRMLLALAAPGVLLAGGVRAFVRGFSVWRKGRPSWAWHGAGWVLLLLMLLVLTTSLPALTSTAVFG